MSLATSTKQNKNVSIEEGKFREQSLAFKYGILWKDKALKNKANYGESFPVTMLLVRHTDGQLELVNGRDLSPLKPGCFLLNSKELQLARSHSLIPSNTVFLPGNLKDWGNYERNFITINFAQTSRMYILLPHDMQEPPWLYKLFYKLREPLYQTTINVDLKWNMPVSDYIVYYIYSHKNATRPPSATVYKSKQLYNAGDEVVLGGPCSALMTDAVFIVGFATERPEDDAEDQSALLRVGATVKTGENISSWPTWVGRFTKAVQRGRLADLTTLLTHDAWENRSVTGQSVNFLLGEDSSLGVMLATELALRSGKVEVIVFLVTACGCELSYRALRYFVRHWEDIPAKYGAPQQLLLNYINTRHSPLSVVACCLMALRSEISVRERDRSQSAATIQLALRRFTDLQGHMLKLLGEEVNSGEGQFAGKGISGLKHLLDPTYRPSDELIGIIVDPNVLSSLQVATTSKGCGIHNKTASVRTISEHSPLRVAFENQDFSFAANELVESYTRQLWRGEEYQALTKCDGAMGSSIMDPSMMFVGLRNMGLANEGPMWTVLLMTMRTLFLMNYTPTAYFNSARGRWAMKLLATGFYIVLYTFMMKNGTDLNKYGGLVSGLETLLCVLAAASILEALQTIATNYKGDISLFVKRATSDFVFLLVDFCMAIVIVIHLVFVDSMMVMNRNFVYVFLTWASLAILVYLRVLMVFVPIFTRLGPLLNTVWHMMGELQVFAVPFVVITMGFATTLNTVFGSLPGAEFGGYYGTLLSLFQGFLGNFEFSQWDFVPDSRMRTFGIVIIVIYLVISALLLANLLIAIVSYKYRPELVKSQAVFNLAEVVDRHQVQVGNNLLGSPYCLLLLPFYIIPSARRRKLTPYSCLKYGLAPIDGFTPAYPGTVPAGRDALPQLLFHMTLHPIVLALCFVSVALHAPFCLVYFVLYGHELILTKFTTQLRQRKARGEYVPDWLLGKIAKVSGSHGGNGGGPRHGSSAGTMGRSFVNGAGTTGASGTMDYRSSFEANASGGRAFQDSRSSDGLSASGDSEGDNAIAQLRRMTTMQALVYFISLFARLMMATVFGVVKVFLCFNFYIFFFSIITWLACITMAVYSVAHGSVQMWYRQLQSLRASVLTIYPDNVSVDVEGPPVFRQTSETIPKTDSAGRTGICAGTSPIAAGKETVSNFFSGPMPREGNDAGPAFKGKWMTVLGNLRRQRCLNYISKKNLELAIRRSFGASALEKQGGVQMGGVCSFEGQGKSNIGASNGQGPDKLSVTRSSSNLTPVTNFSLSTTTPPAGSGDDLFGGLNEVTNDGFKSWHQTTNVPNSKPDGTVFGEVPQYGGGEGHSSYEGIAPQSSYPGKIQSGTSKSIRHAFVESQRASTEIRAMTADGNVMLKPANPPLLQDPLEGGGRRGPPPRPPSLRAGKRVTLVMNGEVFGPGMDGEIQRALEPDSMARGDGLANQNGGANGSQNSLVRERFTPSPEIVGASPNPDLTPPPPPSRHCYDIETRSEDLTGLPDHPLSTRLPPLDPKTYKDAEGKIREHEQGSTGEEEKEDPLHHERSSHVASTTDQHKQGDAAKVMDPPLLLSSSISPNFPKPDPNAPSLDPDGQAMDGMQVSPLNSGHVSPLPGSVESKGSFVPEQLVASLEGLNSDQGRDPPAGYNRHLNPVGSPLPSSSLTPRPVHTPRVTGGPSSSASGLEPQSAEVFARPFGVSVLPQSSSMPSMAVPAPDMRPMTPTPIDRLPPAESPQVLGSVPGSGGGGGDGWMKRALEDNTAAIRQLALALEVTNQNIATAMRHLAHLAMAQEVAAMRQLAQTQQVTDVFEELQLMKRSLEESKGL